MVRAAPGPLGPGGPGRPRVRAAGAATRRRARPRRRPRTRRRCAHRARARHAQAAAANPAVRPARLHADAGRLLPPAAPRARRQLGVNDISDEGNRPTRYFSPPAQSLEIDEDGNTFSNDATCLNRLTDGGTSAQRAFTRCNRRQGFPTANMRLRLEPTLHISDTVRVHSQVDFLDNLVLGSTPQSLACRTTPARRSTCSPRGQTPPQQGRELGQRQRAGQAGLG